MFEKDLNNKNTDYDIYKDSSSGNILALYKDCVMQRIFEKDPLCESFVRLANDYTKINDEKSKILYSDQNQINQLKTDILATNTKIHELNSFHHKWCAQAENFFKNNNQFTEKIETSGAKKAIYYKHNKTDINYSVEKCNLRPDCGKRFMLKSFYKDFVGDIDPSLQNNTQRSCVEYFDKNSRYCDFNKCPTIVADSSVDDSNKLSFENFKKSFDEVGVKVEVNNIDPKTKDKYFGLEKFIILSGIVLAISGAVLIFTELSIIAGASLIAVGALIELGSYSLHNKNKDEVKKID